MKKLFALTLAFIFLITLNSCNMQKINDLGLQRQWMLIGFKNYKKEDLVKTKAYVDFSATKSPKDHYTAFMGCNRMFFTAKFFGNKVEFSQVGSTMMACDKNEDLEMEFAKELPQMKSYKIKGHFLTLSAENGETMKFVAEDWD